MLSAPTIRPPMLGLHLGLGIGVGLAVGVGLLVASVPVYACSTSVLVEPIDSDVNMRTEAELVGATQIAADAEARMAGDPARPLAGGRLVRVDQVPGTSVLVITFEAGSAAAAQAGATAYAEAYLADRREAARAALDGQIAATQQRLDEVRAELGGTTALIDTLPPDAAELGSLRTAQESLTREAAALAARLHELRTRSIDPGRIVDAARIPTAPVRPDRRLVFGLGAGGGALAGLLLHLLRTRWSRRVRRVADLRRHRVPVLAERAPAVGDGLYDRMRNEVVAALKPTDHIILVSGAAPGPAGMLAAASLAAAFARADSDVVLVGASAPRHEETLAALFDVADIPGLTDVLAGRTTLARAVQQAARYPRLRVVTPGGAGTAGGLLQSEGARSVLRQLATRTRYVIVAAPSTASGADAQSLASAADVALLVVELDRTRHAQIADAATQLARVGTPLLGAVVVPRSVVADEPGPPAWSPPPAYRTEAWIGRGPASRPERGSPASRPERPDAAALDGPTRALNRLNRSRPSAGGAAPTTPSGTASQSNTATQAGQADPAGPDPAGAGRTATPTTPSDAP